MIKVEFKISRKMTNYPTNSIGIIGHSFGKNMSDTLFHTQK